MSNKTIVVTGAAGFLGSNLTGRLLQEGHRVIGIDNLSMGHIENLSDHLEDARFRFIDADVTDKKAFRDVDDEPYAIVHLAAFKIPRYGNAIDTLQINYRATDNVLSYARKRQCKCVIASTSDVYGRNPDLPFSEERSDSVIGSSLSPRWGYAVSKLFDEHLALAYQDAYGFPVVILRFFGSYGPNQPLSWWGGPPPVFIDAALHGKVIPIHGDGQQTRSFTYVSDTVDGIYESIKRDDATGRILNIGNTEEITILELAKRVHAISGADGEPNIEMVPYESFTGKKYEDVRRRVPDISLAAEVLDFRPSVGLDEGLRLTIEWQKAATEKRGFGM